MKTFSVNLGDISVEASDTDDILLQKAKNHLPQALKRLGEKAGQEAWATMERGLRNSPLKLNNSSTGKAKFIREAATEFAKTATAAEKKNITESIYEQLQQQRNAKA